VQVHHREDEDAVGFTTVEYTEGETVGQATANVAFKNGPCLGMSNNAIDR
jgi:hypothetical protein